MPGRRTRCDGIRFSARWDWHCPGQKEARYAHLLCGEVTSYTPPERPSRGGAANDERVEKLEQELESLRSELGAFRQEFEDFKKQFE